MLTAIDGSPLMRSSDFAGIISAMAPARRSISTPGAIAKRRKSPWSWARPMPHEWVGGFDLCLMGNRAAQLGVLLSPQGGG